MLVVFVFCVVEFAGSGINVKRNMRKIVVSIKVSRTVDQYDNNRSFLKKIFA